MKNPLNTDIRLEKMDKVINKIFDLLAKLDLDRKTQRIINESNDLKPWSITVSIQGRMTKTEIKAETEAEAHFLAKQIFAKGIISNIKKL
jgi:hypothetical protein